MLSLSVNGFLDLVDFVVAVAFAGAACTIAGALAAADDRVVRVDAAGAFALVAIIKGGSGNRWFNTRANDQEMNASRSRGVAFRVTCSLRVFCFDQCWTRKARVC